MGEAKVLNTRGDEAIDLPPGFRFHPTDEEIITHYLCNKVFNGSFSACAIGEVDFNKCEPWDLPKKAKMGEKEWYFFSQKDRKYPTGLRTNRATESGYWKATGKDKEIYRGRKCLVGMKKTLVFYKGRAPKGEKTNWVMHEYRLEGKLAYHNLPKGQVDEWVVCRIFHKITGVKKIISVGTYSPGEELLNSHSLPPLVDPSYVSGSTSSLNEMNGVASASAAISTGRNYHLLPLNTGEINPVEKASNPGDRSLAYLRPSSSSFDSMLYQQISGPPLFTSQGMPTMPDLYVPYDVYREAGRQATIAGSTANNLESAAGAQRMMKMEQFSSNNRSMLSLSQDTGLSTDANGEISSSAVSNQEVGSLRDLLDYSWDY